MQSHAVTHRDFVFEDGGLLAGARVQHAVVLDIAAVADANVVHVATRHRAKPHGRLLADVHVADDLRAVSNECGWMYLRMNSAEWTNHVGLFWSALTCQRFSLLSRMERKRRQVGAL